ncbi:hypothetical protein CUC04_02325 [Prevotella intermedia]|uniref:Uncharacterized protein n=1 Tax=Prevotella intermedia TaxID=28131 RepID=A0A2G9IEZ1_PREIN|nr:hypothetical protein CUC04_02325 [Prevotella intermedia]
MKYLNQILPQTNVGFRRKESNKGVNIFHKRNYYITSSLSAHCKTYCFAMQKRRFYTIKAAVLHCKTAAFAMPKSSYHFLTELFLQI